MRGSERFDRKVKEEGATAGVFDRRRDQGRETGDWVTRGDCGHIKAAKEYRNREAVDAVR